MELEKNDILREAEEILASTEENKEYSVILHARSAVLITKRINYNNELALKLMNKRYPIESVIRESPTAVLQSKLLKALHGDSQRLVTKDEALPKKIEIMISKRVMISLNNQFSSLIENGEVFIEKWLKNPSLPVNMGLLERINTLHDDYREVNRDFEEASGYRDPSFKNYPQQI